MKKIIKFSFILSLFIVSVPFSADESLEGKLLSLGHHRFLGYFINLATGNFGNERDLYLHPYSTMNRMTPNAIAMMTMSDIAHTYYLHAIAEVNKRYIPRLNYYIDEVVGISIWRN